MPDTTRLHRLHGLTAPALQKLAAPGQRLQAWWHARRPRTDTLPLTQRNVYILPTRAGLMFAATLLTLLVASINFQLSLGYVLTFLLAGSAVVSLHITHGTLRGLTLHLRPVAPAFAGEAVRLNTVLTSPGSQRFGIGLRVATAPAGTLTWIDVPAGGQSPAQVSFIATARGMQPVPTLGIETRFPLGLFRAWALWRPAAEVLVYPRPEHPAAPLPLVRAMSGDTGLVRQADGNDTDGVRTYRRGDPLKSVMWKKAAKALESGGELVSRDTRASARHELWLDWADCSPLAPEDRLSRLAAWVLEVDRASPAGAVFGLRLPGREIAPSQGDAHRQHCLEVLALWQ